MITNGFEVTMAVAALDFGGRPQHGKLGETAKIADFKREIAMMECWENVRKNEEVW
jgi:hypothetical protein